MRTHNIQEIDLPHIAVIDSRTGAKIVTMKGLSFITSLCNRLTRHIKLLFVMIHVTLQICRYNTDGMHFKVSVLCYSVMCVSDQSWEHEKKYEKDYDYGKFLHYPVFSY